MRAPAQSMGIERVGLHGDPVECESEIEASSQRLDVMLFFRIGACRSVLQLDVLAPRYAAGRDVGIQLVRQPVHYGLRIAAMAHLPYFER